MATDVWIELAGFNGSGGGGGTPTGTPNTVSGFDNAGNLSSINSLTIDTTTGGLGENLTISPNGLVGYFNVDSNSYSFTPLQNSPDESWGVFGVNVNLDVLSSGFSQGTNGNAVQIYANNIVHHGTGNVGNLNFISNNFDIGNGTDPITVNGLHYNYGFGNINANVTLDGSVQGYGFQPNVNASAIISGNAYFNAFFDGANIGVPVNGYESFSANPVLAGLSDSTSYQAFSSNAAITEFFGGAGFTAFSVYGSPAIFNTGYFQGLNIANTISDLNTANYSGFNLSPTITDSGLGSFTGVNINPNIVGGGANFTGINVNPYGGATLANTKGISINMSGISSTDPQGTIGIESDSRMQVAGTTQLLSAQTFQIGSRIEHLLTVPAGSPVTGTDELAVNIAGDFLVQDDVANGAFGIGFNSVGFIASMGVATGKTVDSITTFLPAAALPDPGFVTGGTVSEFHMIRTFPPLPQGGTLSITNLYAFKLDSMFGDFASSATNAWGIYLDSTAENYIASSLAIGTTSKKVTNSSIALEIGGTTKAVVFTNVTTTEKLALTAVPGMQVFDTTLSQMSYYNGTTWVNF